MDVIPFRPLHLDFHTGKRIDVMRELVETEGRY